MAVLNLPWARCWCFRTVRAGSIASAIYAVVCSVLRLMVTILEEAVIEEEELDNVSSDNVKQLQVEKSMEYVEIILAILLLVAGICLLIGIFKDIAVLLIPFIILFSITVGMEILLAVMVFLLLLFGAEMLAVVVMLALVMLFLFVDVSCLLCVISHYQNIRAGREPIRAMYRSQGQRMTAEDESHQFQGAAALPAKEGLPADPVQFSGMSYLPVGGGEAPPPPYTAV